MGITASNLTKSRYYSSAFNAAIYDGVIRVYFAQHQEAEALKLYFKIQEKVKEKELEMGSPYVFVMLYPDSETFSMSFGDIEAKVGVEEFEQDFVVGINGPVPDDDPVVYNEICYRVLNTLDQAHFKTSVPGQESESNS